jgi:hypothetical protein
MFVTGRTIRQHHCPVTSSFGTYSDMARPSGCGIATKIGEGDVKPADASMFYTKNYTFRLQTRMNPRFAIPEIGIVVIPSHVIAIVIILELLTC